ncbi:hypothetical protein ACYPKM_05525 [Pseudomonas aeruginosa]
MTNAKRANELLKAIRDAGVLPVPLIHDLIEREKGNRGELKLSSKGNFDLGFFAILANALGRFSSTNTLSEITGLSQASAKLWVKALKEEAYCTVVWETFATREKHSRVGQLIVKDFGVFDAKLYAHLEPYAKLIVENWKRSKGYLDDLE